jgi:hypothetical protein
MDEDRYVNIAWYWIIGDSAPINYINNDLSMLGVLFGLFTVNYLK